jgi:cyclophilin family peptidyl-prolyl cis-trans isomerase
METTLGDFVIELDAQKAPISTANFLTYVNEKFYDGTIFHRVIPTFMIQGGGFDDKINQKRAGLHPPIKNEWKNGLKNVRGTIAMARTSAPDSATAQFFINVVDNDFLDQPNGGAAYAVFGKVVDGMDTVDKIKETKTENNSKYPGGKVVPVTAVVIKSARVVGGATASAAKKETADESKGGK